MTEQTIIPPSVPQAQTAPRQTFVYGTFMDRLIAITLDMIVLNIALFVLVIPLMAATLFAGFLAGPSVGIVGGISGTAFSSWSLSVIVNWLYFAGCESSPAGATLGKRLMKLRVLDEQGRRLSFGRATLRYFGKIVSYVPLMLGFIMALFTTRKQALHDLIAGTIVIERA